MTATQTLADECLELQIQTAGKKIEIANLMLLEPGCDYFGQMGERDFWRMQMEALIEKRSPAQIARMEVERDEKRFFFETDIDDPGCQAVAIQGEPTVSISNNSDSCGSTETGLGATVAVELTREDARRLVVMLNEWLTT